MPRLPHKIISIGNHFSYKSLFIILFFLLIGIVALFKFNPKDKVSAAWWNDGWGYRKALIVSNASSAQTNTQIKILSNYDLSALVTAGKIQSNLNDLRFTDSSGKLINYWIEDATNNSVDIWGFFPSVSTTNATIYMYYGNPSATAGKTIVGTQNYPGLSCKAIKESGATGNQIYFVDTDGGNTSNAYKIYCDLTTDSGGWMLIGKSDSTLYTHAPGFFSDGNIPTKTDRGSINVFNIPSVDNNAEWAWLDTTNDQYVKFNLTKYQTIKASPDTYTKTNDDTGQRFISSTIAVGSSLYQWTAIGSSQAPTNAGNFSYTTSTNSQYGTWGYAYYAGGAQQNVRVFMITNNGGHEGSYGQYGLQRYNPSPYIAVNSVLMVREANFIVDGNISTAIQSEEQSTAPVAYWKFDEGIGTTALDSSFNSNNLVFGPGSSAPTWKSEDQCISGKCLYFDGNDDYMGNSNVNYNVLKQGQETASWTLATWVKPSGQQNGSERMILGRSGCHGGIYAYPGYFTFAIKTDACWTNAKEINYTPTDMQSWHYLVAVYNNRAMSFYADGKLVGSDTFSATMNPYGNTIFIGGVSGSYAFKGFIDEPKIYSYARTAAQIKSDYAAGKSHSSSTKGTSANLGSNNKNLSALTDGLVGYWKMDESTWTSAAGGVIDSSGNNANGTAVGATLPTVSFGKFGNAGTFTGIAHYVDLANIPLDTTTSGAKTTVSFWMNWNGGSGGMPFGFTSYDLYFPSSSQFGFNTGNSDLYGFNPTGLANTWVYVTAIFTNNAPSQNEIYVNGIKQTLSLSGTQINRTVASSARIATWPNSTGYNFNGKIDDFRIYNRALSPSEIQQLYMWAPGPVRYWDLNDHTGTTVTDKAGINSGSLGTGNSAPTWTNGKYGSALNFNGTNQYVLLNTGNNSNMVLANNMAYTISAWVNPSSTSQTGVIYGEGAGGSTASQFSGLQYTNGHFNVNYNDHYGVGDNIINYSTSDTYTANNWYYVSLVRNNSNFSIYVNGISVGTTSYTWNNNWVYSMVSSGIGAHVYYAVGNFFKGSIDDVKLYNYARTPRQIIEDMNGGHPIGGSPVGSQIGYWKFDEGFGTVANDSSSQGNTANLTGSTIPTWTSNGKFGKALSFINGSVSGTKTLNLTNEVTFTAWINPSTYDSNRKGIVGLTGYSPTYGYSFNLVNSTLELRFQDVGTTWRVASSNSFFNSGNVNQWYHVAVTHDGINTKFYINGNLQGSVANPYIAGPANNTVMFGAIGWNPFVGLIDEVKIYNSALTAEDIKLDYNRGSALVMGTLGTGSSGTPDSSSNRSYCIPGDTSTCNPPVGEWKFEEGVGTSAYDTSGNGLTGTLANSPTWTSGVYGKALSLNENNSQYISTANGSNQGFSSAFTAESWIKKSAAGSNYDWIIDRGTDFGLTLNSASTTQLRLFKDSGTIYADSNSFTSIADNKWHHIAATFDDPSNSLQFYLDGKPVGVGSSSAFNFNPLNTSSSSYFIGAWVGPTHYFNGQIDQVQVYDYARTPAQIAWDYNKGGPIAWWKFDECQGSTVYDSSGVGTTGSISIGTSGTQNSLGTCAVGTSAAWTNGASGKLNSSLSFDGTDDVVNFGNPSTLQLGSGDFTISLFTYRTASGFQGGSYFSSGNYTSAGFDCYDSKFTATTSTGALAYVSFSATLNKWEHHVFVVTQNSTPYIKHYINGVLNNSGYTAYGNLGTFNSTYNFRIGISNAGGINRYFNGLLDDFRIYNYALSQTQIKQLYNNGAVTFNQ